MSPLLKINKRLKRTTWLTIDMRDDERVGTMVMIPVFGRNHHAGLDCWCQPFEQDGMFVHNAEH